MTNAVRELRVAAGLSQAELAGRSGVAQPNIAAYESGRRRASATMLDRLRAAVRPLPHDALAAHRDDLLDLAGEFGLSNVRVFGSAVRGADTVDSDLDILVTRAPGTGLWRSRPSPNGPVISWGWRSTWSPMAVYDPTTRF